MLKLYNIAIFLFIVLAVYGQNTNNKIEIFNTHEKYEIKKMRNGNIDPRISNPIIITIASTLGCGAIGYGIGYWSNRDDRVYRGLSGLGGMAIGATIGFAGGLTFGIIKGQKDYKKINKSNSEIK